MEIEKIALVSTAHLTKEENDVLFHGGILDPICTVLTPSDDAEAGYLLYLEQDLLQRDLSGLSNGLRTVVERALAEGAQYVRVDASFAPTQDIESYDW